MIIANTVTQLKRGKMSRGLFRLFSNLSSRATAMRERKIILNVFKHFKTENSSLNGNAAITLTFKVPRIVKHGVKSPSKIRPHRKKEFNKLNQFNLGVVRRTG